MKTVVQCKCGSAFNAPASLVGQVVKCPLCGDAMRVPGGSDEAVAPGLVAEDDGFGGGFAKPQATGGAGGAGGSTMGGSSMRTGMRRTPTDDAVRPRTELCPRCRAVHVEAGRLCTSCLYEMHTGDRAGPRGRFRFTLGLGISAAILLLAAGIGTYLILGTFNAPPPAVHPPANAADNTADPANPGHLAPTTTVNTAAPGPAPVAGGPWVDAADAPGTRYEAVERTEVEAQWDPATGAQHFTVHLVPSGVGEALNMGTRVTLYRAADEDGPFTPVARATPGGIDPATGALAFKLSDAGAVEAGLNQVFYRLSGDDGGLRLFDTPPAGFAVIPPPRIDDGRLKWSPAGKQLAGAPSFSCALTIDAPGWEQVALGRVALSGPTDVALPGGASGVPVRATLRIALPTRVAIASGGTGQWRRTAKAYHFGGAASGGEGRPLAGIVPTWACQWLRYDVLPNAEAFTIVSEEQMTPRGGTVLSFRYGDQSATQLLELPVVPGPAPQSLRATPFDRSVRLTWSPESLSGVEDKFDGPVQYAVFRTGTDAVREVVATLPLDRNTYTDTDVKPGAAYRYEVRLTSASDPNVPALYKAQAWIAGHGLTSVLTPVSPHVSIATVMTEPGMTAFRLSLGQAELCYPGTDEAALAVMEAIRETVRTREGTALIERGALERAMGEGAGAAAHVELTLVDAMTPNGPTVEVWAADLVTGQRTRWCAVPVEALDAQAVAATVMSHVAPRLPESTVEAPAREAQPQSILLAPLLPLDQPRRFYGSTALERDLLQYVVRSGSKAPVSPLSFGAGGFGVGHFASGAGFAKPQAAVLLSGRTWFGEGGATSLVIHAMDAGSGLLLETFREAKVDGRTPARFVEWCETLRVHEAASALLTDFGERPSPLRDAERALGPVHPVWQAMANGEGADAGAATDTMGRPMAPLGDAVTLVLGLPLPKALRPFEPATRRDAGDPLAVVRPYVASVSPATFDAWAAGYAQYIQDDYQAFQRGLADAAAAMRRTSGPFTPRLIVRGEHRFTGGAALSGPVTVGDNPVIVNVRGFFPLGASGQPIVEYRPPLDDLFRRRPWAAYHAWKQAPHTLAEAFVKGVLLGVENGNYGHADLNFRLSPPLHEYIAAALLDDMGNGAGANFRRRAVDVSTQTLRELIERDPQMLTPRQAMYVSRALLILVFENDPGVIQMLRDPRRMELYIQAEPRQVADTLRMLVDRVGPTAWQWGARQPGLDWNAFLWRSPDEMRLVTDAMPDALPDALYAHVRESLDAPVAPRAPRPPSHPVPRRAPARSFPGR